jgi:hypothetical protein
MRLGPHPEPNDLVREVADDQRQLRTVRRIAGEQHAVADLLAGAMQGVDALVLLIQQGAATGRVGFGGDDGEVCVELSGAAREPVCDARQWLERSAGSETDGDGAGGAAHVLIQAAPDCSDSPHPTW